MEMFRVAHSEVLEDLGSVDHKDFDSTWAARGEWLVRHTQPTWHAKDRSLIGSSKAVGSRLFTMFHSQREKLVQIINNANTAYVNSDKTDADLRISECDARHDVE